MDTSETEKEFETPLTEDESVASSETVIALDAASRTPMTPEEALHRIRRGETIAGVTISRLTLKGDFDRPVQFENVTLLQPKISKANFAEGVVVERCTVDRLKLSASTFAKGFSFDGSTLLRAEFRGACVRGPFGLGNVSSRGKFLIEGSKFHGKVRCWEASFQGWVTLRKCEFEDEADLRSLHAAQGFVIHDCSFRASFLFRGSTVEKKFEADRTRFEGLTDFSKAKFHDFVYLEAIEQSDKQTFAFTNALAERILVRPEQLEGRLASENAGDHSQAMHEYGLLKRVFEGLHRYEHEDWAFYRFKVNQRRSKVRLWNRPWTKVAGFCDWLLLDHGCGYGTNPLRAVRAALIIILAFGAIYALGVHQLHVEVPPFDSPKESVQNRLMIGRTDERLRVYVGVRRHSRRRAGLDELATDRRIAARHSVVGPVHRRV